MTPPDALRESPATFTGFLKTDLATGIILVLAAALGIFARNSGFSDLYDSFLHQEIGVELGFWQHFAPTAEWIKDGLMAVFFLLVGLEIKREAMTGVLADPRKMALPAIAALGGMVMPALILLAVVQLLGGSGADFRAWPVPVATDIAFALAALSLAGRGVPIGLRVFLLALAVIDDLGAILLIAVLFSGDFNVPALIGVGLVIAILYALNRFRVTNLGAYLGLGIILWAFMLASGLHATLAGVILAMLVPLKGREEDHPPLEDLEHALKPWVAFVILPLFAFAFAGFSFEGLSIAFLAHPVSAGVGLGLLIGKPLGILLFSFLAVQAGIGRLPDGVRWISMLGLGFVAGIGFTMSLFVGELAFADVTGGNYLEELRLGVIFGSLVSTTLGILLLRQVTGRKQIQRSADGAS